MISARLEKIGQVLLVLSNKGGVGKSTVAANLAVGLAAQGQRVGLADADIHGPNQSRFFGLLETRSRPAPSGLTPGVFGGAGGAFPLRVGSLAFLLAEDSVPIVWRDAYKHDFLHHLIGSFDWGPLDTMVVDMPPGTGNELITLCDLLEGYNASAVLVSTPQAVAQMDSLKAARFCQERGLPILGAVENMAGVTCPQCGGEFHLFPDAGFGDALEALGIARLARIPLVPELALGSDTGVPVVAAQPDGAAAHAFRPLIRAAVEAARAAFQEGLAAEMSGLGMRALVDGLPVDIAGEAAALLVDEAARLSRLARADR
nr:P-loop NTPase [Rhodovulum imhoffii]